MKINEITSKQKYRILCENELTIPLFSRAWWLDAVCDQDNWGVLIAERDKNIVAFLPYSLHRRFGFNLIRMPILTPRMGVWIKYPEGQKLSTQLGYEKEIFTEIICQLPYVDWFSQLFHYAITNVLPFYWQGFHHTTRYTYVLEEISDVDRVWRGLQDNIRREIRKAKKHVAVYNDPNIEQFLDINTLTFQRQGRSLPYSRDLVRRLDAACAAHSARRMWFAEDAKGRLHAAVYIVWDENSAYYLMGGGDPELRTSGATSLLMWEGIQFASTVTKQFDFEGSMMPSVERFFRAFGARQVPYLHVTRMSRRMRLLWSGREIVRAMLGHP